MSALSALLLKDEALMDLLRLLLDQMPLAEGSELVHVAETLAVCTEPIYNPTEELCSMVFECVSVPQALAVLTAAAEPDALVACCHLLGNFAASPRWRRHVLLQGALPVIAEVYQVRA